ncbi:MAG: hypothetical protein A2504_00420 [Bdellovibrionales bacterium RIFOXYD12_FULL_39_22]|nr:MAG: hypothetical protein A2385_14000 [Bdellovibrionales bacterium RIFOXYB1_FULL_39_21]OFZ42445.1 MAG: hypothetical protein A2485_04050 [Bdellovibrionales bacterium RIFOXYC12_FULL_39_17]OFZ45421.1 MAG: hypothetical protein A2404_01490 [Bdellovibrionales bacterium RIFOXYC1_FULL_39_130]OFZ68419.1 MAG: hypothetical protein A2451_01555 [Bdellovibrionales bacterium RIFOXYC2_FULL_39_8]OFZ74618.1 MAG: hypothetical protein A2560_09520 [Bdellovibrionales bacterium RIFOXYD1_FULL_39_84]OFZ92900.1 MAG:
MAENILNLDYNLSLPRYSGIPESKDVGTLFNNLIWLTTKEASVYLRKSVNAIHTLVSRRKLRARKFTNRLYFKRDELDYLIETSQLKGG